MKRLVALAVLAACHHVRPVPVGPLPRAAYGHYVAGKLALYRDDPETAASELQEAAAAAPDQPMIAVELARALAKAKRDDEARAVLARTRSAWPDHPQVWLASGEVLEQAAIAETKRGTASAAATRRDAMKAYRRAIALESSEERGYLGLARTELAADEPRSAEKTLRSLIAKLPGSVDGHYRLAQRLAIRNDLPAAIVELRAVLEHDPDHLDGRLDLARMLRRLGKLDEAVLQTRSAFDRAGQPMDIAEELYWLLCEADDRQAAIDLLTLLDDDRSDADALATVARFHIGLGRFDEALALAEHVGELDPDGGTLVRAQVEVARHAYAKAAATALTVAPQSERYSEAQRVAADALISARDPKAALQLLRPLRHAKPDDLELALADASARADTGDAPGAHAAIAAVHAEPLLIAIALARLADHVHDRAAVIATLEPVLRAHPDNVTALNLLGYALADGKQRLDDAERYLAHARELSPGDPAILDSWGWLLLARGRTREAIRALDHASRFAPREAEIALHLATAWAADHAPRTAAEVLDRAAGLDPTPDVQRRIDALRATLVLPSTP